MASSIINSDDGVISGTSGLKSTGGDDGVLVFQSKGTETARINTDKQIEAAAGTALLPSITTTGDVNTGIFFSAANTVDIATDGVARAQINSAGDFAINAGFGSVGKAYLCRAWVNFDGTGTPAIREDGNVSSITDNGTGQYTINFTTAMPDVNYAFLGTINYANSNGAGGQIISAPSGTLTVSAIRVACINDAGTYFDQEFVYGAIFR